MYDQSTVTSYILRTGVYVSLIMLVAGVFLLFVRGGGDSYTLQQIASFNAESNVNSKILFPSDFFSGLVSLDGLYYISVALWVLIFTPVTVLIDALITYIHQKNRLYVILNSIVLFNLLIAIFLVPRFIG